MRALPIEFVAMRRLIRRIQGWTSSRQGASIIWVPWSAACLLLLNHKTTRKYKHGCQVSTMVKIKINPEMYQVKEVNYHTNLKAPSRAPRESSMVAQTGPISIKMMLKLAEVIQIHWIISGGKLQFTNSLWMLGALSMQSHNRPVFDWATTTSGIWARRQITLMSHSGTSSRLTNQHSLSIMS